MKRLLIIATICSIYFIFSIAWSKNDFIDTPLVCYPQLDRFLNTDTNNICFRLHPIKNISDDSLFFRVKNINSVSQKALEVCKLLKDSCNVFGTTLLFYDTTYSSNFVTLYRINGKLIFTNKCP